ncbi:hypothetical protein NEOKW01_0547 [Nematocida sp. AWRm80]|nr:hypothetical protein NEOKW01_0547 [Nematocida sp. AWRm80]
MGNILGTTTKNKIILTEEKINKTTRTIQKLTKNNNYLNSILLYLIYSIILITVLFYVILYNIYNINKYILINTLIIVVITIVKYIINTVYMYIINRYNNKIRVLKEIQKKNIEYLKRERDYDDTQNIINRYNKIDNTLEREENTETRETILEKVVKRVL